MRIVFWGTPGFAAPPLRALIGEGFDVVGVVTQPDKPQGRSRTITTPIIKDVATAEEIPVLQPRSARDPQLVEQLRALDPDISIVVAYGHILPKEVIDLPPMGTLNIHASLLPALRGAAPIQAAINQGLTETGVSIMRMVPDLDAGPVVLQATLPIYEDETFGELQNRLSELGALRLLEALALISVGGAKETPQNDSLATYAPKLDRKTARIDWTQSAYEVARHIRSYDPKPGAYTTSQTADVKMFGPRMVAGLAGAPGEVLDTSNGVVIACGSDSVRIHDVQPAGKGRMTSDDWTRGRGTAVGERFGV